MKARKLITYHFFCLLSFQTHGIASVARLQREEVSRAKTGHGGTGTFSTWFYKELASSVGIRVLAWHGKLLINLLEVLHHLKIHCKFNYIHNGAPFDWFFLFPTAAKPSQMYWNGIFVRFAGFVVMILLAIAICIRFVSWSSCMFFLLSNLSQWHYQDALVLQRRCCTGGIGWRGVTDCNMFGMFLCLHQMAVDALQHQIQKQYSFCYHYWNSQGCW